MSVDVPILQSYGIYISQLVRFTRSCTSCLDLHSKEYSNHFKNIDTGLQISHFETKKKHLEYSPCHTLSFCLNVVKYRFKNVFPKESITRSSTVI